MRFLIDAQLPPSLAATLRECGQDAVHVFALLPANAPDTAIWNLAIGSNFVLVTKDEDFAEWSRLRSIPCAPRSDGAAHGILRWPAPWVVRRADGHKRLKERWGPDHEPLGVYRRRGHDGGSARTGGIQTPDR